MMSQRCKYILMPVICELSSLYCSSIAMASYDEFSPYCYCVYVCHLVQLMSYPLLFSHLPWSRAFRGDLRLALVESGHLIVSSGPPKVFLACGVEEKCGHRGFNANLRLIILDGE
eukprot:c19268_g1_i1 orf=310-654(+)